MRFFGSYLKFWSDADNEDNTGTSPYHSEDKQSMILDFISTVKSVLY